jgi:cobalt-zinc-cadmium efflux system protein
MPHDHTHAAPTDLTAAFQWGVGLNAAYVVLEAAAGFLTGSLALIADAAHNLTDVGGLLIAWGAVALARRAPTARFTYGLGRATQLAALGNATFILIGVGAVLWEAIRRFADPTPVPGGTVMAVALVGIAINVGTAMLFRASSAGDLNAKGAYLHMMADAAVSLAVVLAAAGILVSGWLWLDPAVAILVSLVIAVTAFGLFRSALDLTLDAVPEAVDRPGITDWLAARPGVDSLHDLHIWALSTTRTALTVHLVMPDTPSDDFLHEIAEELEHHFGIAHATIQIEKLSATCDLARCGAAA